MTQATLSYDLEDGNFLHAYAIDPALDEGYLAELISSKDGRGVDLEKQAEITVFVEKLNSYKDLELKVSPKEYQVPKQLQKYRDAIGERNDAKGWYNGTVAIANGPFQKPFNVNPGGFYDYTATMLDADPSELLPDVYPKGKTINELFQEWGVDKIKRGRYLGIAYILETDNGRDLSLVQRAKNMAIASDCLSSPGSTPNFRLLEEGFDPIHYLDEHIPKEIEQEYKLKKDEFNIGGCYIFDDKNMIPFLAIEIQTQLKTEELAGRIYRNEKAIREHPVVVSFPQDAIPNVLDRFAFLPATAAVIHNYNENRN